MSCDHAVDLCSTDHATPFRVQPGTLVWVGTDGKVYVLDGPAPCPPPGPEGREGVIARALCERYWKAAP